MDISNNKQDSHSPSETLYKYLLAAELPKNQFLDKLQEEYFTGSLLREYNEIDISNDNSTHEPFEWELYGNHLIEMISNEMETNDEGDMEVQSNQQTFIGSLDCLGNGYGKHTNKNLKIF